MTKAGDFEGLVDSLEQVTYSLALGSSTYRNADRDAARKRILDAYAGVVAERDDVLALGQRFDRRQDWSIGQIITHAKYLQDQRAEWMFKAVQLESDIAAAQSMLVKYRLQVESDYKELAAARADAQQWKEGMGAEVRVNEGISERLTTANLELTALKGQLAAAKAVNERLWETILAITNKDKPVTIKCVECKGIGETPDAIKHEEWCSTQSLYHQ